MQLAFGVKLLLRHGSVVSVMPRLAALAATFLEKSKKSNWSSLTVGLSTRTAASACASKVLKSIADWVASCAWAVGLCSANSGMAPTSPAFGTRGVRADPQQQGGP